MTVTSDVLGTALERLQNAAGADRVADIEAALAETEQILRDRKQPLRPADGKLVEVERPRLPSATVDRRAARLRKTVDDLLRETQALRAEAPTADPESLRRRTRELADSLQEFVDQEAKLVLQSVNTDIGGAD